MLSDVMKSRITEIGLLLALIICIAGYLAPMVLDNKERSKVNESRIENLDKRGDETSEILREIQGDIKKLLQRKE